ncbi:MAG: pyruvate dehydrogenase (acetyl-transferring) E1 component subunit alpha [Candidatus Aenigmarchaeota archaeon]|nr:pyruvate dehydrogenase (acetyl-transferring) E1 component subunit alpha [Candidatus Aenigmarchaeota archaeon]
MPRAVLGTFAVEWLQVLDERGKADPGLLPPLGEREVKDLYELMAISRVFDEQCLTLQREGRLGTYAAVRGQEAAQVGSAYALQQQDWLFPSFRENAALIARHQPLEMLMAYWAGDERGQQVPASLNNFPVAIPVGTQAPHAVGAAWAFQIRKEKAAALVYFGDGATSKGDVLEAMNFAGVFKLPVVFFCQNNQWAISLPAGKQTAAQTLAQKAIAFGFPGIRVDGNDVFAVYLATHDALERARSGEGPTFIEAFTYRVEHHTTSDDSSRYRAKAEVDLWRAKDPLLRLEAWMEGKGFLDKAYRETVWAEARKRVQEAVEKMEQLPPPKPGDIFDYVFAQLPPHLQEQKASLLRELGGQGGQA